MKPTDEQAGAWTESFDSGKFVRKSSEFRDQISMDGTFGVESGRYHLYVSHACPWAHRTIITRALLGLEDHISVDVVDWRMNRMDPGHLTPKKKGQQPTLLIQKPALKESTTGPSMGGMKAVVLEQFLYCGTAGIVQL